ncbi:MAG: ABC transporter permease [Bacteroidetes bacterium]|nr:ABC transporter permease [Bacteroidota bacterium]
MSKVPIIIGQEFRQKLRSKAFIVMTLLAPALLALTGLLPKAIDSMNSGETKKIVVIDQTKRIAAYFANKPNNSSKDEITYEVRSVILQDSSLVDSLKNAVEAKQIAGVFLIPPGALADTGVVSTLRLSNTNDFSIEAEISARYEEALFVERLRYNGVDPEMVRNAQTAHKIQTLKVDKGSEAADHGLGFAAGYICGFFIYFSMILYGSLIMQSVIEEKSTRVIELLASSARPIDILVGKVLGVGLAGLVQVTVWALMFAALPGLLPNFVPGLGNTLSNILEPVRLAYFIGYFLFGYLIFSVLYAAAGATVEQASDAQQVTLPITILIMVPFLTMTSVIQAPSSTTSVVLSLIPFFSPILMIGRIFSETPPFWQIALSFVLMGLTFYGVLWLASKIYRTGILMYGKKYTLKEIFRWVRYS